jgi:hypothetical protein
MKLGVLLPAAVTARAVTPTQKVVQLLQDMSATGKQRMQEEQVAFAKFSTFCTNEQGSLASQIKKGKALMDDLSATIQKATSDADLLGEEISGLNADLDAYAAEQAKQKSEREAEHKSFLATEKDLSESVDALARATTILKRQNFDRAQAKSFLQTSTEVPVKAKALIQDFLALDSDEPDFLARSGPEAHAYEFQGGGIVEMLENLSQKFKTELSETQKAEVNSRHAFEMAMQHLAGSVEFTNESVQKKSVSRNKHLGRAAKAQKELAAATATYNENRQTLSDLETECKEKALSYEEKQKLSADELEALGEAIAILDGDSVQGAASRNSIRGQSFIQLSAKESSQKNAGDVLNFLAQKGEKLHSHTLNLLATKLANDPFGKVVKMIKAMVTKLMNQQNEEAETKGFCDKELKTNKMTRDRLASEMDALRAEMDEQSATAKQLGESIAQLSAEVTSLDAAMQEAVAQRTAENEKNTATVKDAKAAQQAVAQATAVLKDFYAKAGAATAFIQVPKMGSDEWQALANPNFKETGAGYGQGSEDKVDKGHKAGMQTFGESYSGQQDSANGVLAMLEIILSDFANLETATATDEATSQKAHERFMVDSKKDKKVKSRQIEMQQADKEEAEHAAAAAKRDLSTTDDQALAADRYYESLKPKCVDEGVSFEERDAKRADEIAALKEALQMLQPQ